MSKKTGKALIWIGLVLFAVLVVYPLVGEKMKKNLTLAKKIRTIVL